MKANANKNKILKNKSKMQLISIEKKYRMIKGEEIIHESGERTITMYLSADEEESMTLLQLAKSIEQLSNRMDDMSNKMDDNFKEIKSELKEHKKILDEHTAIFKRNNLK